ncbi:MAG: hypothetical protein ACREDR_14270 [Blastocatellia bacterium]
MAPYDTSQGASRTLDAALTVVSLKRRSSAGLIDLSSVEQLQSEFNRDHGSIRILVLMSPT